MEHREYKSINKSVRKKDSMQLLLGKPVYTDDVTPDDALVVKILRSPHANAIVESINTAAAKKVPGVVDIYTWEDVPQTRFAIAGQTYPEPSPYDRLIIDRHVRFSGDVVAITLASLGLLIFTTSPFFLMTPSSAWYRPNRTLIRVDLPAPRPGMCPS